jgi:hypothetical protein
MQAQHPRWYNDINNPDGPPHFRTAEELAQIYLRIVPPTEAAGQLDARLQDVLDEWTRPLAGAASNFAIVVVRRERQADSTLTYTARRVSEKIEDQQIPRRNLYLHHIEIRKKPQDPAWGHWEGMRLKVGMPNPHAKQT